MLAEVFGDQLPPELGGFRSQSLMSGVGRLWMLNNLRTLAQDVHDRLREWVGAADRRHDGLGRDRPGRGAAGRRALRQRPPSRAGDDRRPR